MVIKQAPIAGLSGMGGGASGLVQADAFVLLPAEKSFTYDTSLSWDNNEGDGGSYPRARVFNGSTTTGNDYENAGLHCSTTTGGGPWYGVIALFNPPLLWTSSCGIYAEFDMRHSVDPEIEWTYVDGTSETVTGGSSETLGSNPSWRWCPTTNNTSKGGLRKFRYQGAGDGYCVAVYAIEIDGTRLQDSGTQTW